MGAQRIQRVGKQEGPLLGSPSSIKGGPKIRRWQGYVLKQNWPQRRAQLQEKRPITGLLLRVVSEEPSLAQAGPGVQGVQGNSRICLPGLTAKKV